MSPLAERLARLHAAGRAKAPPALWSDPRAGGIGNFTPAAVLIAVTDRAEAPGVLLIERPTHMRSHPGQIAFPGGRCDAGEDAITAALREAGEELGISAGAVRVIGTGDIHRTGSAYEITPVLALVPADLPLVPNPDEVAGWFEAPLAALLDPANHRLAATIHEGERREYVEIFWRGRRIWGVTAAMIANLSRRLAWAAVDG